MTVRVRFRVRARSAHDQAYSGRMVMLRCVSIVRGRYIAVLEVLEVRPGLAIGVELEVGPGLAIGVELGLSYRR